MTYYGRGAAVGLGEGDHRAPRLRIVVGQLADWYEVKLGSFACYQFSFVFYDCNRYLAIIAIGQHLARCTWE